MGNRFLITYLNVVSCLLCSSHFVGLRLHASGFVFIAFFLFVAFETGIILLRRTHRFSANSWVFLRTHFQKSTFSAKGSEYFIKGVTFLIYVAKMVPPQKLLIWSET